MKLSFKRNLMLTFLIAYFMVFATSTAKSQNVLNEAFNYGIGDTLNLNGYITHSGAGVNLIKVVDTALIYASYPMSGNGYSVKIDTTGEDLNKTFLSRTTGTVYAAFMAKVKKATTTGDYFFHLGQTTIGTTFFVKTFAKLDPSNPAKFAFGVSKTNNASTATFTGYDYYLDSTYVIMVSYEFVSGSTNDPVKLWVNPSSSTSTSPTLTAGDVATTDRTEIGTFALRQGSSSNAPRVLLSGLIIDTLYTNIYPAGADLTAPTVNSVVASSNSLINVTFSEAVGVSAEDTTNYDGLGLISAATRNSSNTVVTLNLVTPLTNGVTYNLQISGVQDLAANTMTASQSFPILIPVPVIIPKLVITEISYNDPSSADSLEYVELFNNDTVDIALTGMYFSSGITGTLPSDTISPGDYFIFAYSSSAMTNNFGISSSQWTSGNLSNSGEPLCIKNATGDTIDFVNYDDASPWPTSPDGSGPSLVLCNPNLDNNVGSNWSSATTSTGITIAAIAVLANPGSSCSSSSVVDTVAPVVNSVVASNNSLITITFNEEVGTSATDTSNYDGLGTISSATINSANKVVSLNLTTPLTNGVTYTLIISNVKDTANNTMIADTFQILIPIVVPVPDLVITEINYNDPYATDTLEYIEIYNNGSTSVNMNGFIITSAVEYTFPSYTLDTNSYVVVALNSTRMQSFFNISALQWTSGNLNNSGETILFKTSTGDTIDIVSFDDSSPWPTSPDGTGPSLVLCDPSLNNSVGANWSAATTNAGTTTTGIIVYANPGTGCNVPQPAGDTIPPVVNSASATSATTISVVFNEPVGISAEDVSNYSGVGTISTAIRNSSLTTVTLTLSTALTNGNIYNLVVDSIADTSSNIMAIAQNFQVLWNSSLPSLVITEINYNGPESGTDTTEFVELFNNGSSAINLGGLYFSSGITYTFPSIVMNAGDYVVIAQDSVKVNNFFNISSYKWTSGGLSNSGEALCIKNANGDTVDYVSYGTSTPWPTAANGQGASLVLCNANADNSLAANWSAANTLVGQNSNGTSIYANPGTGCGTIIPNDTIPPVVTFATATTQSTINVEFNEAVSTTAENTANYTGVGTISSATRNASLNTVTLTLATPLVNGNIYTLTISSIEDTSTNVMATSQSFNIFFNSGTADLVITEIMYNDVSEADSLEYFEIYNNGTTDVNLTGFSIADGIVYSFPAGSMINAGQYLVIAKDSALVNSVFNITGTHQWTSGGLKNSGEPLLIINSNLDTIDLVVFSDIAPWNPLADGGGASLELCDKTSDNNNGANWSLATKFIATFNGDSIFGTAGEDCFIDVISNNATISNLNIYPNPAHDNITIKTDGQKIRMQLMDMRGAVLIEEIINNPVNILPVSNLSSGIYNIQLIEIESGKIINKKIVVN